MSNNCKAILKTACGCSQMIDMPLENGKPVQKWRMPMISRLWPRNSSRPHTQYSASEREYAEAHIRDFEFWGFTNDINGEFFAIYQEIVEA